MPRKKKKLVSVEVVETNSTWDYRNRRIFNNFICAQDDAESTMQNMDHKKYWKLGNDYANEYAKNLRAILAPKGTRNSSDDFFENEVFVDEVKLPSSVKPSMKYIYKVCDYSGDKLNIEYGSQKDIVAYISKKIKTKYTYITYNGVKEKIEYAPKTITRILGELEETTSQFEIEQACRSGETGDLILVTIFNNCTR